MSDAHGHDGGEHGGDEHGGGEAHGHGDGHGHDKVSPFIAHHFEDEVHQFEAGKLGIWLFLGQEILFFSALFVAYIIYRNHHPDVFAYAHKYLDVRLGAINTGVLILSSLSAAWAVRAAQLGQRKLLIGCLLVTILCAFGFLGIKYVEYTTKIKHGTLFGKRFHPHITPDGQEISELEKAQAAKPQTSATPAAGVKAPPGASPVTTAGDAVTGQAGAGAVKAAARAEAKEIEHGEHFGLPPPNTGMFFTLYFAMTGLHGFHVLAGIFVFIWLLIRAIKGHFNPDYFGPVDFAALYWHLVDLIWIFLFPLLYLIH
jgi:cytochrome c oxidase subunit III